ncbi:TonB-dependent receptor [Algoriphagus halophytocola]|uniref:TonB-dependent receptor n=1 Tax=Algoriphagus halophytocola TaxID=2991499 RepID=A0ABY6MDH5_9BACT|nr:MULTISPECIES: TonB-dependent receptor [unclassified Algoriphagus]UZD21439.1 TonB-dependent receptor [Algoriphagus sp. TR-M5]WBL42651.1 TonB-dependent receptor [Algoriphagus sp. TR-M9]
MNGQLYLTALFFFFHLGVSSQTLITGKILDEKGQALPGVNVFIKGSFDGTSSSIDGSYEFETSLQGKQTLVFKFLSFKTQELELNCEQSEITVPDIQLVELITEMNAVTISAGAMQASDESKSVILKPLDIVTTPSAMGDIMGAFQTLPGTSTVGNDGRLFVRGGDASEVGIYIDGMKVGNAYGSTAGNVPTRTRFNPNLFKGTFFSTGGYSAEYGQALSSALALNTKDLSIRNQGDLSLMTVGGGYSHTLANERQSITASANYFNLGPYQELIKQNLDFEKAPESWDVEMAAQKKTGKNGLLKVMARTEAGGMKLWQPLPGSENRVFIDLKNNYTYAQANWRSALKNDWMIFTGFSYSKNKDRITYDSLKVERESELLHFKATGIKDFSDRFSAKFGVEHFVHPFSEKLVKENQSRAFNDHETYLFTEWDYYFNKNLVLRTGLRAGNSEVSDETWIDPRISLAYQLGEKGQLSVAAGKFHQLPEENYRVLNQNLKNTESNHLILNYLYSKEGYTFRAETFYKTYDQLVTFQGTAQNPESLANMGAGYAKGIDFFFRDRKTFKETDYWVTYSFVDSKRSFHQYQTQVQPSFAPRHNFSLVVKHFISPLKSQIGASFAYNDGYTYTDPNVDNSKMNSKTKYFQNLSISWSYLPKPNLIIHLACSNVLGRDNVFGYTFSPSTNDQGVFESIPNGQLAPRFLFLGVFLTLSKDKTANNLNNL